MRTMKLSAIALITSVFLVGCGGGDSASRTGMEVDSVSGKPSATATRPADSGQDNTTPRGQQVLVRVGGEPIYMAALDRLILPAHGLSAAQQLIATEVVRQEAEKEGISVTDEEVRQQNRRTMEKLFPSATGPNQRQRLLRQLLQRQRVSEAQWQLTMRRNALLRKLVVDRIRVTEKELDREFGRKYGRQLIIRHIQTATLNDAQKVISEAKKPGADFAELAKQYSTNPSGKTGGLLGPVTAESYNILPAIKSTALQMDTPGEISDPVQVGTAFHVLKLERIEEPKDVKLAEVREEITRDVRYRKSAALQQTLLKRLITQAEKDGRIQYVHPILKRLVDEAGNE
ncbi:MAG: peptidylprolyl isomerase [Phycisphaerae bacterium]